MSLTRYERDSHTTTVITMANTARRNALSAAMSAEIVAGLDRARRSGMRSVILRAEPGAEVWSAGHDVRELPTGQRDPLGWNDTLPVVVRAIEEFPAPVIALIEGSVWGGACEMALACDLVIATPDASFALTPAKLGVPYSATGLLTFLNAMSVHLVRELAFTARPIGAIRAAELGIINRVVPADRISDACADLASGIAELAPLSIAVMKEQLRLLASAHAMSPHMFEGIQGLRRRVYDSDDYREGIAAFKEKRPASFVGR